MRQKARPKDENGGGIRRPHRDGPGRKREDERRRHACWWITGDGIPALKAALTGSDVRAAIADSTKQADSTTEKQEKAKTSATRAVARFSPQEFRNLLIFLRDHPGGSIWDSDPVRDRFRLALDAAAVHPRRGGRMDPRPGRGHPVRREDPRPAAAEVRLLGRHPKQMPHAFDGHRPCRFARTGNGAGRTLDVHSRACNREKNIYYCLLCDLPEADSPKRPRTPGSSGNQRRDRRTERRRTAFSR